MSGLFTPANQEIDSVTLEIKFWMRDELERRKQLYRDLFAGKPLKRLPVDVRVAVPSPYTTR